MFNKKTTQLLLIAVVVLGAFYWYSENKSARAQERTFREIVVEVDQEQVVSFSISSGTNSNISFAKEGSDWFVSQEGLRFGADPETVNGFLEKFDLIETQRFVGSRDLSRARYGLSDVSAKKVLFSMKDGSEREVLVGTLTYANDTQGQQSEKITYFSVDGEQDVYAGASMLGNDVQAEFDLWRPRYLWKGESDTWQKMVLVEGEASMTLEKKGDVWMMLSDTLMPDPMQRYMDAITEGRVAQFDNKAQVAGLAPIKQIIITDAMLDGPRSIKVYEWSPGQMVMVSDMNPESVFLFDADRAYRKLFRPPSYFIPLEKLKDNPELQ